ncbi:zeta toxin family protein [Vibrio metschnikovii]|uniref:zeta toxin family protein n=1 Tax=Vibrio metschnikovii TaxID=28172 RepID=UPI001C3070A4|nr:zeta toxin family protein [Vibrio metschnikovii]
MSFQEEQITEKAIKEAKKLKKKLAREMVDHLPQEESAVSVFMAGSPGAGKTETARNMIKTFKKESGVDLVHIENDELRKVFADYDGINSPLFQKPATLLVEAIHDRALKKDVSFILDSTLSSLEKAKDNIQRSLKRNRYVLIIFVYQEPEQAWCLVKAREIVEGRRVPEEVFVNQFMESQRVVSELKKLFQDQVDIIFIEKNIDGRNERPHFNVSDIDALLRKKYNREFLEAIVGLNK